MRKSGISASVLALSAALCATPALAQPQSGTGASKTDQLGDQDIVVTATRREETLRTVPISVTALTGANIQARGITTVENLASSVPNLTVRPAAVTKVAAVLIIRGQVQRDNLPTLDPAVGVYVDDTYLARAYSALSELLDVQRVEVLRGPQGTLFGRNTIGGAIRVITNKPDVSSGLSGSVSASAGNYGLLELSGAVTIPIIQDRLAIRYAGNVRKHNAYTHSYLVSTPYVNDSSIVRKIDTDNEDVTSHRLSVAWHPTDTTKIDGSYYYFQEDSNGSMVVNRLGDIGRTFSPAITTTVYSKSPQQKADYWSALTDTTPFSHAHVQIAAANIQQEITDNVTLKLMGSYAESKNEAHNNTDGYVPSGPTFVRFQANLNQGGKQYTGEVQLSGNSLGGMLDWIGGLYYFKEKAFDIAPVRPPNTGTTVFDSNAGAVEYSGIARNTSKSGYLSANVHVSDALTIRAGGRYTEDTKSLQGFNRNLVSRTCVYLPGAGVVTSTTAEGPCEFNRTDKFKYWIYDVGVDWKVTDSIFLYAKTGNGYRGGGQQLRAVDLSSSVPFRPDSVKNYEAGIKASVANVANVSAAVFHVDYSDVQQSDIILVPGRGTITVLVNKGSAKVDGFEVEGFVRPVPALRIDGSLGYNRFKYSNPITTQAYNPDWKYSLSATWTQPIGSSTLTAAVNYDHSGAWWAGTDNKVPNSRIPGYDLVGARVALALNNGVELAVWGRNLTKEKYSVYTLSAADTLGEVHGAPRTFGATARYSF